MYLARVIGRVVASERYPGLEGVALQLVQPLAEDGTDQGDAHVAAVATSEISVGPGDFVNCEGGREAALVLPETYVPVDAAIIGFVEAVERHGELLRPAAEGARS